ncbi:DUF3644 domain-containing protein [Neptunicoccus cionae]|uniref:DUF3644 domain-containing protein n=1 Tax=Neptunicoccus cionae TaxID=2035344 RepID=A0A916VT65_9RHOB|nr:DUF3644 domain-containing protein [Amylibacter cionae]GGA31657.1 hypothetical protein GCM10011498_36150 [Amylibacter cionae]
MIRRAEGALTAEEKKVVKGFLAKSERNQDIQALVNIGRKATINSARITEVKRDNTIVAASDEALEFYKLKKKAFDPQTGLNLYEDERLIRAREAMLLAVQVFNSPTLRFKAEVFAVQANIAWTYLLHEYYERKGVPIIQSDGRSLLLSQMTTRSDCPISQGIKDNLESLKRIRDTVEHTLFRRSDIRFLSIFQACCLNFDKTICELFGADKALSNDLSFSLQFAKMDFDQLTQVQKYEVPAHISALEKEIDDGLGEDRLSDIEYRFRVVYTFENSTKSKSHIKFVHPTDEDAEEVRKVLIKNEISDKLYPNKAGVAADLVRQQSGRAFTMHNHTQAWRKFDIRPRPSVAQPENTNKDYCIYHEAHGDYTYSDRWVEFLVTFIASDANYEELKKFKL